MARDFAKKIYNSKRWIQTRELILKRDKYLCRMCGEPAAEVHHKTWLTPMNANKDNVVFGDKNLISLCRDCHFKAHGENRTNKTSYDASRAEYFFDTDGLLCKRDCKQPPP